MERQEIIAQLAKRDELPWSVLKYCRETPEACVPTFLLLLEREARGLKLSEEEQHALFFGVHLLAAHRISEAFAPLTTILCGDIQKTANLIGDAIGDTIPRVLMALVDDRTDTCWDIVAAPQTDWLVREAFLRCWTYQVLDGNISFENAEYKLRQFPSTVAPEPDNFLWNAWMTAIADLGLSSLSGLVEQTFSSGLIENDALANLPSDILAFHESLEEASEARRTGSHIPQRWKEHKGYVPFSGTSQDFIQAGRHVLSEQSEPVHLPLKAADGENTVFDSPANDPKTTRD